MGRGSPRGDAFDLSPGKMRKRGLSQGGPGSSAQALQREERPAVSVSPGLPVPSA